MDKAALEELLGVELTDEQYESFNKQHESELDKARTQASATAAKNAAKKTKQELEGEVEKKAKEQAQQLLQDLLQTDEERMEGERKALEQERQALEAQKRTYAVETKLKTAGYEGDTLESLTSLFSVKDTIEDCESAVDSFLGVVNKTVEAKVDDVKAQLTGGGAASKSGGMQTAGIVNENQILEKVYSVASDANYVNSPHNSFQLDLAAITQLEAAYEAAGGTE